MLPKVESPIPETIGLTTVIGLGVGIGMTATVLAMMMGLPDEQRDAWSRSGMALGFLFGLGFYFLALVVQLLCRQ